jgi:hypothetical protein
MFRNRRLLIATKHNKEAVIAPLLERELGVTCFVPPDFDTDVFGTFSGEIKRTADAAEAARAKCEAAMRRYNCDLAVSSEGSFGPHPALFFVPADEEILLFTDKQNDLEIMARSISTETNFSGEWIKTEQELNQFAERVGFPSHALLMRRSENDTHHLEKGITDRDELLRMFREMRSTNGGAFLETDMRACFNPTRMQVIAQVTEKLIAQIRSCCPRCSAPGFNVTDAAAGLPCSSCGRPTRSTLYYNYTCRKCSWHEERFFPHTKTAEDPMYCDHCNP